VDDLPVAGFVESSEVARCHLGEPLGFCRLRYRKAVVCAQVTVVRTERLKKARSSGAVHSTIDAAAADQRSVGGSDDHLRVHRADVAAHDLDLQPRGVDSDHRSSLRPGVAGRQPHRHAAK
jgi:hypothetical protein